MSDNRSLAHRIKWASKFFTHGRKIASLTPSSRWLSRSMCRDVDASRPQVILELGAGMGPVTAAILACMHPESRVIAVELDPELQAIAQRRCPTVDVVLGSASDVDNILDQRDIAKVDCFLSCLPTPSLPQEVNRQVLDSWQRRCTSGVFTQITQIPWYYKPMYGRVFHDVEFALVPLNVPPAGVYHCRNLREDYAAATRLPGKSS